MDTSSSNELPTLNLDSTRSSASTVAAARWHLLRRKIRPDDEENFSKTHRYRIISHEEFRILSTYLNVYHDLGKLIVEDSIGTVILHRLTGFQIEQSGWRYLGKYSYDRIPNPLGEHDHVLVVYGTVDGMHVHISYAQADRARFREMVVTGVLEPKTLDACNCPPLSKLLVTAEKVARNQQRIAEAQRLLASEEVAETEKTESIRNNLNKLVSEFRQENDFLIASDRITPRMVDDAIAGMKKELHFLQQEYEKSRLLIQIDDALDRNENDYSLYCSSEDRKVQAARAEAIHKNIEQHKATLEDLGAFRTYLLSLPS